MSAQSLAALRARDRARMAKMRAEATAQGRCNRCLVAPTATTRSVTTGELADGSTAIVRSERRHTSCVECLEAERQKKGAKPPAT